MTFRSTLVLAAVAGVTLGRRHRRRTDDGFELVRTIAASKVTHIEFVRR